MAISRKGKWRKPKIGNRAADNGTGCDVPTVYKRLPMAICMGVKTIHFRFHIFPSPPANAAVRHPERGNLSTSDARAGMQNKVE